MKVTGSRRAMKIDQKEQVLSMMPHIVTAIVRVNVLQKTCRSVYQFRCFSELFYDLNIAIFIIFHFDSGYKNDEKLCCSSGSSGIGMPYS